MSTYCVEHELLVRATKESERTHAAAVLEDADAALTAAQEADAQQPAAL